MVWALALGLFVISGVMVSSLLLHREHAIYTTYYIECCTSSGGEQGKQAGIWSYNGTGTLIPPPTQAKGLPPPHIGMSHAYTPRKLFLD